ncbi:tyrosine--tRNA ligase [Candidatus Uhrbacteria bacterium]|nr:tyrosine--tRNA ligase [Candidatus Uhrbacteria bacterium]
MPSIDTQLITDLLTRGVEHVYPSFDFLEARLKEGKRLRLYLGIDPTGTDLHIGHSIQLRKLREFQRLGHEVILLIGNFTAMIGDPTDKSAARKRLTAEEVMDNAKAYKQQASKILDFGGENPVQIKFNADWLGKMSFADVVDLASHASVQQMLERDMFQKRIDDDKPIYIHEFLYPLMQGQDSIAMDVDGEIGGNDQTFNMLMGRDLMKSVKGKEKFVVATKLLVDSTGKKMGKTGGNMVRLMDAPADKFGKVMSWPDGLIVPGMELLTDMSMGEIKEANIEIGDGANPKEHKMRLAFELVKSLDGEQAAMSAKEAFVSTFSKGEIPSEMPEFCLSGPAAIIDILVLSGLVSSKTDARRTIRQGGVKIAEKVVADENLQLDPSKAPFVLQKGKHHFLRIIA